MDTSSELTNRRIQSREESAGQRTSQESGSSMATASVTVAKSGTSQLSSFILFASLILLLNLCPPFQLDFQPAQTITTTTSKQLHLLKTLQNQPSHAPTGSASPLQLPSQRECLSYLDASLAFVKLMFRQPMRLEARATRFTLAEARMLGKMAKVWYIKKKIKKLSKKLKKHTIAVPVFTAIPIYEHSYYPQPHVTHVTHGGAMHHAAAASSYAPSVAQVTSGAASPLAVAASAAQQMTAAASNQHAATAYRLAPGASSNHHSGHHNHHAHHHSPAMYGHAMHGSGSHQIINAYAPSQPLYVDDAGGLYGQYGNAYGRYDGGFHLW